MSEHCNLCGTSTWGGRCTSCDDRASTQVMHEVMRATETVIRKDKQLLDMESTAERWWARFNKKQKSEMLASIHSRVVQLVDKGTFDTQLQGVLKENQRAEAAFLKGLDSDQVQESFQDYMCEALHKELPYHHQERHAWSPWNLKSLVKDKLQEEVKGLVDKLLEENLLTDLTNNIKANIPSIQEMADTVSKKLMSQALAAAVRKEA